MLHVLYRVHRRLIGITIQFRKHKVRSCTGGYLYILLHIDFGSMLVSSCKQYLCIKKSIDRKHRYCSQSWSKSLDVIQIIVITACVLFQRKKYTSVFFLNFIMLIQLSYLFSSQNKICFMFILQNFPRDTNLIESFTHWAWLEQTNNKEKQIKPSQDSKKHEDTSYQNIWDTAKVVLWGAFIITHIKKKEKSLINNLTSHIKEMEKEEKQAELVK